MRTIQHILFETHTPKGVMTETIFVGQEYWDMGVCVSIVESANHSFIAAFDSKKEYELRDVKRILFENGTK
jgi:hypothetical protein